MISIADLKHPHTLFQRIQKAAEKLLPLSFARREISRTQQILAEFAMPARCEEDLT